MSRQHQQNGKRDNAGLSLIGASSPSINQTFVAAPTSTVLGETFLGAIEMRVATPRCAARRSASSCAQGRAQTSPDSESSSVSSSDPAPAPRVRLYRVRVVHQGPERAKEVAE